MKQKFIDVLKAFGLTASGFLAGYVISKLILLVALKADFNPLILLAAMLFAVLVFVNYQIVKK